MVSFNVHSLETLLLTKIYDPTSGGAVLCSKLVEWRYQIQVALVDLGVSAFFSETRVNTG